MVRCFFPTFDCENVLYYSDDSDDLGGFVGYDNFIHLSNEYFLYTKYIYSQFKDNINKNGFLDRKIKYNSQILNRLKDNRANIVKFFSGMDVRVKFNYCIFFKSLIDCISSDDEGAFNTETSIYNYISKNDMFKNAKSLEDVRNNLVDRGYLGANNPFIDDAFLKEQFSSFIDYYNNLNSICNKKDIEMLEKELDVLGLNNSDKSKAKSYGELEKRLANYCNFVIILFSYVYSDPVFILNYVIQRFCKLVIPDFAYYTLATGKNKENVDEKVYYLLEWFSKIFDRARENPSVGLFVSDAIQDLQEESLSVINEEVPFIFKYENGPIQVMSCLSNVVSRYGCIDLWHYITKMQGNLQKNSPNTQMNNVNNKPDTQNVVIFSALRSYFDLLLVKLRYIYNFIFWNRLFFKLSFFVDDEGLSQARKVSKDKEEEYKEYYASIDFEKYKDYDLELFKNVCDNYENNVKLIVEGSENRKSFFSILCNYKSVVGDLNLDNSQSAEKFLGSLQFVYFFNLYGSDGIITSYFGLLESCLKNTVTCLRGESTYDNVLEQFYGKDNKVDVQDLSKNDFNDIFSAIDVIDAIEEYDDDSIEKKGGLVNQVSYLFYDPIVKQLEDRILDPKYLLYDGGKLFKPKYISPALKLNYDSGLRYILSPSSYITPNFSEYCIRFSDFNSFSGYVDYCSVVKKILDVGPPKQRMKGFPHLPNLYSSYKYLKSRNVVDDVNFFRDASSADPYNSDSYDLYAGYMVEDIFLSSDIDIVFYVMDFVYDFILKPFEKYKDMSKLLSDFGDNKLNSYFKLLSSMLRCKEFSYFDIIGYIFRNYDLKLKWIEEYQSFYWKNIIRDYLSLCRNLAFECLKNLRDIINAVEVAIWFLAYRCAKFQSIYNRQYEKRVGSKFNFEDLREYLNKLELYCKMWHDTFEVFYNYLTPACLSGLLDYMNNYIKDTPLNKLNSSIANGFPSLFGNKLKFDAFALNDEIDKSINETLGSLLKQNPNYDVVEYKTKYITPITEKCLLQKIGEISKEAGFECYSDICKEASEIKFNKSYYMNNLDKALADRLIDMLRSSGLAYVGFNDFKNDFDSRLLLNNPIFQEVISSVKRTPDYNVCVEKLDFLEDFVQLYQCYANFKVFDISYGYIFDSLQKLKNGERDDNLLKLLSWCKQLNLDDLSSNICLPICVLLDNINYVYLKFYYVYKFGDYKVYKNVDIENLSKEISKRKDSLRKLKEFANSVSI